MASDDSLQRTLRRAGRGPAWMASGVHRLAWPAFAALYAVAELLLLVVLSLFIGEAYYSLVLEAPGAFAQHLELGVIIAALVGSAMALQGGYRLTTLLAFKGAPNTTASAFLFAFGLLVAFLFLSKAGADYSRGTTALVFVAGFILLQLMRQSLGSLIEGLLRIGLLRRQRVLAIVAGDNRIPSIALGPSAQAAFEIVETVTLPKRPADQSVDADFERAAREACERVRTLAPEHVLITLPWTDRDALAVLIARLATLPCTTYLDGDRSLRLLAGDAHSAAIHPLGHQVLGPPITAAQWAVKRSIDVVGASVALVLLAPLMLLTALLIKLDSSGPVIYRQRRHGSHLETFDVFKFRTMSHRPDDTRFRQATRDDPRVTRVGKWLRRTNIDELPQLANVLLGSMSLVGPRPHPVALDHRFMPLMANFAQRYRIRPGITGWAQVNGFRGETDTIEKMQSRLEHDLYYVRHWSLWLDLKILFLTVASLNSYRNAV